MSDLISRQESIKAINKRMDKVPVDRPDVAFGLCVAVGVLHDMPPASQSQDGDRAVSLNAVLNRIKNQYNEHNELIPKWLSIGDLPSVTPNDEEMAMQYQRGYIDGFKEGKVTFEPKTGHWKIANSFCTCDQCEYETRPWNNTPFCPNCGARMVAPRNLKYADNDMMMPAT